MKPKSEIRAEMRALRRAVTPEARTAASESVCGKLVARCAGRSTVAVYLASPQEIDLAPFIRKALETGVRLVAPRWNGATYELATLKGLSAADLRTRLASASHTAFRSSPICRPNLTTSRSRPSLTIRLVRC